MYKGVLERIFCVYHEELNKTQGKKICILIAYNNIIESESLCIIFRYIFVDFFIPTLPSTLHEVMYRVEIRRALYTII